MIKKRKFHFFSEFVNRAKFKLDLVDTRGRSATRT
jgi:hypothetical protein